MKQTFSFFSSSRLAALGENSPVTPQKPIKDCLSHNDKLLIVLLPPPFLFIYFIYLFCKPACWDITANIRAKPWWMKCPTFLREAPGLFLSHGWREAMVTLCQSRQSQNLRETGRNRFLVTTLHPLYKSKARIALCMWVSPVRVLLKEATKLPVSMVT